MKTFKIIDFGIQVLIVATSAVMAFFNPFTALLIFFFGLLAWNLLSLVLNVFLPIARSFSQKRVWLYGHTAVIVAVPLLSSYIDWPPFSPFFYVLYALGLAVYYMVLCYQELRYLNELRDQIRLSDIQQH